MRRVGSMAVASLCGLALSGAGLACGSGSGSGSRSGSESSRAATTEPSASAGGGSGAFVFAHNCTSCHSLIGSESEHKNGGDLVGYHLTRTQLALITRTMPTRPLSAAELRAVVGYVLRAQQRARAGS